MSSQVRQTPAALPHAADPRPGKEKAAQSREEMVRSLVAATSVALLAIANYIFWIHNYFAADSWALVGSISQPDWSLDALLPFRQVPHRINSTFYYSPVYTAVLWLAFKLGGFAPERYHLLLIALHVGATLLLFVAALQLTESRWKATIAAAIFAVHFGNTETVGWIGAITHPLTGFFAALAFATYLRFLASGRRVWWTAAMVALLPSALCQATALPWFAILGLLDIYHSRKEGGPPGLGRRLWVLMGVLALVLALQIPTLRIGPSTSYNYQLGPWVVMNLFFYPASMVLPMLEGPAVTITRDLVLAPTNQDAFIRLMGMTDAFGLLLTCGLVVVAAVLLWTRGGWVARFSLVGFGLSMTPFVLLNGQGYRYMYPLLMFFSIAMASVVVDLHRRLERESRAAALAILAIVPLFLLLSFAESQRQLFWWQQAGLVTHRTLLQLREMQPELPKGAKVVFGGLPDTLQNTNAEVWRNGITEAVQVVYGDRTLKVQAFTREETERLFREELKGAPNTFGFVWEDWQLKRIAP